MKISLLSSTIVLLSSSVALAGDTGTWTVQANYRSSADSPFFQGAGEESMILDNFEFVDYLVPGSSTIGFSTVTLGNSVDGDDGLIDGIADPSTSAIVLVGALTVSFDPEVLGGLPTRVGIVCTDLVQVGGGNPDLRITAVDAFGGVHTQEFVIDNTGGVGDDIFVGFSLPIGVTDFQVIPLSGVGTFDHLQYDQQPALLPALVIDDFDFDGRSDVCWYTPGSSQSSVWFMDGLVRKSGGFTAQNPSPTVEIVGRADLNGDGVADIVFQDPTTGALSGWIMNGNAILLSGPIVGDPTPQDKVIGIDDLNGDRRADIVWINEDTRLVSVWYMNGLARTGGGSILSLVGSECLGLGDLNGDGRADIAYRNTTTGVVSGALLFGKTITAQGPIANASAVGAQWGSPGLADTYGGGKDQILWRNSTTGEVRSWVMNGLARVSGSQLAWYSPGWWWDVAATPDLNGDGKDDILWRSPYDIGVYAWIMDGSTKVSGAFIRNVSYPWQIIN